MEKNYKELAEKLIPNLKKRNFDAYYCETSDDALRLAVSLIDKNDTVAWGGSKTIAQIGLIENLKNSGYKLIDRDSAKNSEERIELMRQALLCDTFLMSTNAISADGILVNIDGFGNRVAALCYGPKSVIITVGMNKVCNTLEDAEYRARNVAAPLNVARFGFTKTGCQNGKCIDCLSEECICTHIVKTRRCSVKSRIKIILIGEDLGF